MNRYVQILDATLRDGGQCLEDLYSNGFSDKIFSEEAKHNTVASLEKAGIDIIELGSIGPSKDDKSAFAIYQNIEQLSAYLPVKRRENTMYVGLYIGPDTDIADIPDWNPSLVEGVRVILRYSELQKSLDYCAALAKKGYRVFVQPMLTMRYSNEELDLIIKASNDMGAYACYFVDSYGYMQPHDVKRLFDYYDAHLDRQIKVGFHAHNNMDMAFANVQSFIRMSEGRSIIIDSCVTGMGQGAGNMQTELLVPYINKMEGDKYGYEGILEVCDYLDENMIPTNLWGFSVTRLLPALYNTAYKYALIMRNRYKLSFTSINAVLQSMPDDMRNRYTQENIEQVLKSQNLL